MCLLDCRELILYVVFDPRLASQRNQTNMHCDLWALDFWKYRQAKIGSSMLARPFTSLISAVGKKVQVQQST